MTNTLSADALDAIAFEEARAATEAHDDMLADLAGSDFPAYLRALDVQGLEFRRRMSAAEGNLWAADRFAVELERRAA